MLLAISRKHRSRRIRNRSPQTQPIGPRNQPHGRQLTISEVISAQRKRTTIMPFGLTNTPATFQQIINSILRQYLNIFVVCYLDDILIFSDNKEDHKEHVHKVLKTL
ncbi:Uncharacterized protein HZ326_28015 [Fusarium oxysporum f. sp. albedinis]|nr:Uncharacterized protein HZ326_28015 [Fusarium oxysporum f. sp. albedinis]